VECDDAALHARHRHSDVARGATHATAHRRARARLRRRRCRARSVVRPRRAIARRQPRCRRGIRVLRAQLHVPAPLPHGTGARGRRARGGPAALRHA
jgi:hypothetical protein